MEKKKKVRVEKKGRLKEMEERGRETKPESS